MVYFLNKKTYASLPSEENYAPEFLLKKNLFMVFLYLLIALCLLDFFSLNILLENLIVLVKFGYLNKTKVMAPKVLF